MTPEKRNSIEELFWRIALHYQFLRILEPEGVTDGYAPNEGVDAGRPVREFPEEAYCFEFEDPGYTLEELLAQITEENRHEEIDFGPPVGKEV